MALTLPKRADSRRRKLREPEAIAVVDEIELEEARRDPRVRAFWDGAEAYVAELERQGRSH